MLEMHLELKDVFYRYESIPKFVLFGIEIKIEGNYGPHFITVSTKLLDCPPSPTQGPKCLKRITTNFNQWIMAPGGVRPPNTSHAASQLSRTDLPKIRKQGSGDTLNAKLNDHIRKTEQKPTITIKPGQKIPTGDSATEFGTEIWIIVRKFAPWSDCPKWKSIKKSDLRIILEKFTIDLHVVRIQKAVNTMLANEYRQFRCTLHKHYLQYKKKMEHKRKTRIIRSRRRIGRNFALGSSLMSFRKVALKVKKVEKRIQPFIVRGQNLLRAIERKCVIQKHVKLLNKLNSTS